MRLIKYMTNSNGGMFVVQELQEFHGDSTAYRNCSSEMLGFKIASGYFYDISDPLTGFLRFKKTANVVGFEHITAMLPELEHLNFKQKGSIPYYAENLEAVRDALHSDPDSVCVEESNRDQLSEQQNRPHLSGIFVCISPFRNS